MRLSSYSLLTFLFVFTFNYVTGFKDSFFQKVQKHTSNCKRGDLLRDDYRCVTCYCVSPGVVKCKNGKCKFPPKHNQKISHYKQKKFNKKKLSLGATTSTQSALMKDIYRVTGCTRDVVQTLDDCVSCECISLEEMSCVTICVNTLASIDYLFGDGENDVHHW